MRFAKPCREYCFGNWRFRTAQQYFEKELQQNPFLHGMRGLAEVFFAAEMFEESKTMFEWSLKHDEQMLTLRTDLKSKRVIAIRRGA
jgi:uncharacterized protein HemY